MSEKSNASPVGTGLLTLLTVLLVLVLSGRKGEAIIHA